MKVLFVLVTLVTPFVQFNEAAVIRNKFLGARQSMSAFTYRGLSFLQHEELKAAHKTGYWGTVEVGTPPQKFSVIFDTGSGNLVIPTTECQPTPTNYGCNPHRKYDANASSTHAKHKTEKGGDYRRIRFATGVLEGNFHTDRFCIASGLCTNVNFIGVTRETKFPFEKMPVDGILGLALTDMSADKGFNILDDLNIANMLPMSTFAVYLTDDEVNSEITFGGYRPEHIASDIVWAKVTKASFWQVAIDDITFNNEITGLCPNGCQVAVDTGMSMISGPTEVVTELENKLGSSAEDACSNFDTLPDIGFKVGDKVLNLSPDFYMDRSDSGCSISLVPQDIPPPKGPLWILGDPFLRRFVTIYDKRAPRVGFAVAKQPNMDATLAAKIISNVKGQPTKEGGIQHDPVASAETMIPVPLTGGALSFLQESPQHLVSVKLNRL